MTRALQAFHHLLRQTFRRAAGGHGQASAKGENMRSSMEENMGKMRGTYMGKCGVYMGNFGGHIWEEYGYI